MHACTVYFKVSLIISFDFVPWPPFCSITHLSKKVAKCKENCETNLKLHCVMKLSLSYKVFRWYLLNTSYVIDS